MGMCLITAPEGASSPKAPGGSAFSMGRREFNINVT